MGVKGLFQFLKRFQKEVSIPDFVCGRSVGIDIFWFIHQSKGDFFAFQHLLLPIIKNAAEVHCVFDGEPPLEKKRELVLAAQKRQEMIQSIQQIESFLKYPFNHLRADDRYIINCYLSQLRKQVWHPTPEYIDRTKKWLESKCCQIYQAVGEADDLLINLEKNNTIDVIITNDSDLLVLGSNNILRSQSSLTGFLFDVEYICNILGFTAQQWTDFMYLCKHMKVTDISLAYSLISVYKNLDYGLQKYYIIYQTNLLT